MAQADQSTKFNPGASISQNMLDPPLLTQGRIAPGWAAVILGFFGLMSGPPALITTSFAVLAAGLAAQTGWEHSAVAYGSTLISLVILFISPLQGFLVDRVGGRRLVLWSMPAFALAITGFAFSTASITTFYINCVIAAIAGIGLWAGPYMKIVSGWFDRRLGIAFGVVTSGIGISVAVIPFLFGWSFKAIGWGATYAVAGATILLVVWPATWRWLRESPVEAKLRIVTSHRAGLSHLLRQRAFWIAMATFLILGSINAAVLVHGVAIMKSQGLEIDQALRIQAAVGLSALFGRILTGWLLDHITVRWIAIVMSGIALLYFAIMGRGLAPEFGLLAGICGGFVVGAEFDVLGVLIRRYIGNELFGRAYGLAFAGFHVGGALGSGGLAFALSKSGSFSDGLAMMMAASVVLMILFFLLGRYPDEKKEKER